MTHLKICFQGNQWTIQNFRPIQGTERQDLGTNLEAWVRTRHGARSHWPTMSTFQACPDLWDGHKSGNFYELDKYLQLYNFTLFWWPGWRLRSCSVPCHRYFFHDLISLKSIKNNIWYPFEYFNLQGLPYPKLYYKLFLILITC